MTVFPGLLAANKLRNIDPNLTGIVDPLLSAGINGIVDFDTAMPFLDIVKQSRPMQGAFSAPTETHDYLVTNNHLTSAGWPQSLPPSGQIQMLWDWSGTPEHLSDYLGNTNWSLTWTGSDTPTISGPVQNVITAANLITFDFDPNTTSALAVIFTTLTGPVTDIKLIRTDRIARYNSGEIFNPDFLNVHSDYRVLRFMDWMQTNNSPQVNWSDRAQVDEVTYVSSRGVPLEHIIALSNRLNCDPWLNIPHLATDAYVTELAHFVNRNLKPKLKPHFEPSNEIWNTLTFNQHANYVALARTLWPSASGESDFNVALNYYGKRAHEWFTIINSIFGTRPHANILGTQAAFDAAGSIIEQIADAPIWQSQDGANYVAPSTNADHIAVTTYYGSELWQTGTNETDIANASIATSDQLIYDTLTGVVGGVDYITDLETGLGWDNAAAGSRGLTLVGYEGLTHIAHASLNANFNAAIERFNLSELRADITERLFNYWRNLSNVGGPFTLFVAFAPWSQAGHWSGQRYYGDIIPFLTRLRTLQSSTANWFGATGDYRHTSITGLTPINVSITPLTDLIEYAYHNSTYAYNGGGGPGADNDTEGPNWTADFAAAYSPSTTYQINGQEGFAASYGAPTSALGYARATVGPVTNGNYNATVDVLQISTDNFTMRDYAPDVVHPTGQPNEGESYLSKFLQIIDAWEAVPNPNGRRYIIIEPQTDMGGYFGDPATISAANYTAFLDYNRTTNATWYDLLLSQLKSARPNLQIELNPFGRVLSELLQGSTGAATLGVTDYFVDSAPHGNQNWYCLVGAVSFMVMFRKKPPLTGFSFSDVNTAIVNDWSDIVDEIWNLLDLGEIETPPTTWDVTGGVEQLTINSAPTVTAPATPTVTGGVEQLTITG